MERTKPPLTPLEQLVENYSLSIGVYQGLVTDGVTDGEFLSIVSESIDEIKQDMRSLVSALDKPTISSSSQKIESLNRLFVGRLNPDEAQEDPFFEDFLFSFPATFRGAFGIEVDNKS